MSTMTKNAGAKAKGRIARARHIQHMAAAGHVAASRMHADELSASRSAVQMLKSDLCLQPGVQNAASIARSVELRARLDAAEEALALAIAEAQAGILAQESVRIARRMEQNAAEKLHQRALQVLKIDAEQRAVRTSAPRRLGLVAR